MKLKILAVTFYVLSLAGLGADSLSEWIALEDASRNRAIAKYGKLLDEGTEYSRILDQEIKKAEATDDAGLKTPQWPEVMAQRAWQVYSTGSSAPTETAPQDPELLRQQIIANGMQARQRANDMAEMERRERHARYAEEDAAVQKANHEANMEYERQKDEQRKRREERAAYLEREKQKRIDQAARIREEAQRAELIRQLQRYNNNMRR